MFQKIIFILISGIVFINAGKSQNTQVPESVMIKIYNEVKTPYKYGLVLLPPDTSKKWIALPYTESGRTGI